MAIGEYPAKSPTQSLTAIFHPEDPVVGPFELVAVMVNGLICTEAPPDTPGPQNLPKDYVVLASFAASWTKVQRPDGTCYWACGTLKYNCPC